MKRFAFLLIGIALSFVMLANDGSDGLNLGSKHEFSIENVSMSGFEIRLSYDKLNMSNAGDFLSVSLDGTYPSGKIGFPSLPVMRKPMAIPQCGNYKVVVKKFTLREFDLSQYGKNIVPQQHPISKSEKNPQFDYNAKAYETDAFIGGENGLAWISPVGTMRGVQLGELCVSPLSYNPVTNILYVYNDIELEVVFESVDYAKTEREIRSGYSPFFASTYSSLVNKDIFDSYADLYHTPVKMLVVAHEDFTEQLQPWLEWKTQKGFYVDVDYVGSASATSENISSWVSARYAQGAEAGNAPVFLVLVGDVDRIPASAVGEASEQQTDLYYASVDGDYFPDMYCSRISVASPDELNIVVGKTLMYEKYTMPDPSYLGNALLIAGSDDSNNTYIGQPTINYATQNYFNAAHGYNNVYAYLDSYDGCYDNLSTGVGYAHYTAHGGETEWCGPRFTNDDIDGLTNADKYFLAIGNCCLSGKFGYSEPCYGEKMIRSQKKGAFAYIGSSPVTYWGPDYYWALGATSVFGRTPQLSETETGAFDMMFNEDMFNTVSSIMYAGNLAVTNSGGMVKYYWEAYNVLGDGSVMPYYSIPSANVVSHEANIVNGSSSFLVSANPGSYVALTDGNTIIGTGLVGTNGMVNVPLVATATSDSVLLVVTRQQRFPHIEYIPVVAPEGAYISLVGYSPDVVPYALEDMMSGYSLTLQLKNVGQVNSDAWLPMALSSSDSNVEILENSASCSPIVVGETVELGPVFSFLPSRTLDDGYELPFTLTIDDTVNNEAYVAYLEVSVIRGKIEMQSYSVVGDAMPDGNFSLSVSVTNSGTLTEPVEVALISTNEHLHIDDFTRFYGNVSRDAIITREFPMYADADVQYGDVIPVVVQMANTNMAVVDTAYIRFWSCNAAIRDFPFVEDFASGEIPECWSQVPNIETAELWNVVESDPYDYISQNGDKFLFIKNYSWTDMSNMLESAKFAFEEGVSATLSFRHVQKEWDGDNDVLSVYYKNTDAGEWQLLTRYDRAYESWSSAEIELPNLSQNYYIAFYADLNYGFGIGIDDIRIEVGGCVVPQISFVGIGSESPNLTWTGNAETYSLYKNGVLLADTDNNTYELAGSYSAGDCFEVVAHCNDGDVRSETYCLTGVADEVLSQLEIYPNPASDRVEVACAGMKLVALYDVLGRKVLEMNADSDRVSLPLEGMQAGLYVVIVDCAGGRLMKKLEIM
ncbi:MAG: T9SS type A sorting domain-containing protein [Bacteroidales bacterium]|nr:T9SS type A sorting domain-containing protein [Bacteroidales bacterium]